MCLSLYLLLNIYPPLIMIKKKLNMRLNKTERGSLRKRVEIVIQQMKKSETVNHFQKESYHKELFIIPWIVDIMKSQWKTKWKLAAQLLRHLPERISWKDWPIIAKESVNDALVVSLVFPKWLFVDSYRKWTFLVLNVRKRLNTPRNRQRKQRICAKNLLTYYTDRNAAWFWMMKNISPMMAQTWKETIDITRMTNQNVKIMFALLEKRNIQTK